MLRSLLIGLIVSFTFAACGAVDAFEPSEKECEEHAEWYVDAVRLECMSARLNGCCFCICAWDGSSVQYDGEHCICNPEIPVYDATECRACSSPIECTLRVKATRDSACP